MDIIKLTSRPRTGTGKSYTRKARVNGWIPANYYGHSRASKNIEINAKEFSIVIRGRKTTHLIDLGPNDEGAENLAVIKEIQREVIRTENIIHVDFQHIDKNEKVTVKIPLVMTGESIGVKEDGGILNHPFKTVTIECLPFDIPEKIVIDISALRIGDSIHVRDVSVPNVSIKESADEVLAIVSHPTREEEAKPAVEETATAEAASASTEAGKDGAKTGAKTGAAPAAKDAKPSKKS